MAIPRPMRSSGGSAGLTIGAWACVLLALASAQNDVREPPVIQKPAAMETKYIHQGTAITLECNANGVPKPTYKWFRDGQTIPASEKDYVYFESTTGNLIFNSFTRREEGEYMCVATNRHKGPGGTWQEAVSYSAPITMLESVVENFKAMETATRTGNEYDYLVVECQNKGLIQLPAVTFNWYKEVENRQLSMDNNRLFIDSEGDLHFSYLLEKDGEVTVYQCGVSNQKTNIQLGSPTLVKVVKTGGGGAIPPQFQYSNDGATSELYTDATLECFFSGYDPTAANKIPQIKWFDDSSNEIKPSTAPNAKYEISADQRKLTIKSVQETDEKNFYCQGVNSVGQTSKQKVFLDVISPPIFLQEKGAPKDITRPEHKDAVFYCSSRSLQDETPPEPPVWYVNGVEYGSHLDPSKHILSADKKSLTISKLSKATDIQCVQCSVKNEYGKVWGDACLNVILPITVTNDPKLRQEITKGDTVNLTVLATTDPSETLAYAWEFNNESYPVKPPHVTYNPNTYEAYINTSLLTKEEYGSIGGIYKRILSHANDIKTVEIEVILKDGPIIGPVVSKGGIDMWIIGLIIGIVFLIIVIIIIIFVICRKKQEGDYNVDKKETGAGLDPEKELKEKGFDDYSRPTYDDYEYPEKKPRGELEYDDVPIGGDDESLAEYGDEADTHFNEDGSFIGVYQNNKGGQPRQPRSTESTI